MPIDGGSPGGWEGFQAGLSIGRNKAQTRLYNAQAAEHEEKTRQERALSDLAVREGQARNFGDQEGLQQLAGPGMGEQTAAPTTDPITEFLAQRDRLARLASDSGLVEKAGAIAKDNALIRQHMASTNASASTAILNQLKSAREQADVVGQVFGAVRSQDELDSANELYRFRTGQPSPLAGKMFSQGLLEQVNQAALTTKERADIAEKKIQQDSLTRFRNERLRQHNVFADIAERRLELERQREARLAKGGGGKSVASPQRGELDQADRLIGKDYPNMNENDKNDAAFSVASDARALRSANRALDANTALMQAYNNAVKAGDFTTSSGVFGSGYGPDVKNKTVYSGRGKSAAIPAVIPSAKGDLKEGRYYVNPKGQVGQWTGKGFVLSAPTSSAGSGEVDDGEDNGEED